MFQNRPSRKLAIGLGLIVSVVWSSSWVLIKIGLKNIPPITFAGLRYFLAFLCLLPLLLQKSERVNLRSLRSQDWTRLVLLGVFSIAVTQGAQFYGLALLPAATVSLIFNLSPLLVTLGGMLFLAEYPSRLQWVGMALNIVGVVVYFLPFSFGRVMGLGIIIALIGLVGNSLSSLLGRRMNFSGRMTPGIITTISIGIGSTIMLVAGLIFEDFPNISGVQWLIIIWMAVINTALAFLVWNYILKTLTAMESSMINGTMLVQVAVFAWILLGEKMDLKQIAGLCIALLGIFIVQVKRIRFNRKNGSGSETTPR